LLFVVALRPHLDHFSRGNGVVEATRDGVQVVAEQPGVDVKCHRRRRMAEHLLDCFDVGASADGQARRGVPEVVWAKARKAGLLGCRVEDVTTEVGVPKRLSADSAIPRSPASRRCEQTFVDPLLHEGPPSSPEFSDVRDSPLPTTT